MDYLIYSVEDDEEISRIIRKSLEKSGFKVKSFANAEDFFQAFKIEKCQMLLVDMRLPTLSGQEIIKKIRSDIENDDIEIIIISANNLTIDKVDGFDLGADDYIAKPFDILELISRVNAKYRRYCQKHNVGTKDLIFNVKERSCFYKNKEIQLTSKEFDILKILIQANGEVISRERLLNEVWNTEAVLETRSVDMHISSIRQKLADNNIIQTVYGIGYKIKL